MDVWGRPAPDLGWTSRPGRDAGTGREGTGEQGSSPASGWVRGSVAVAQAHGRGPVGHHLSALVILVDRLLVEGVELEVLAQIVGEPGAESRERRSGRRCRRRAARSCPVPGRRRRGRRWARSAGARSGSGRHLYRRRCCRADSGRSPAGRPRRGSPSPCLWPSGKTPTKWPAARTLPGTAAARAPSGATPAGNLGKSSLKWRRSMSGRVTLTPNLGVMLQSRLSTKLRLVVRDTSWAPSGKSPRFSTLSPPRRRWSWKMCS